MNIKQFTKFTAYGILIFSLLIIPGCSGNPMATSSPEEVEAGIKNGEYVKLSAVSANQITRGRDVFETVMKKYKPVIDFYGADSEVFRKMVNTNLMMNAERLTSPSEKMFNYDSMALWEDTEIVVEYEDGTREALPAAELLAADGSKNPGWYKNGKKIVNYLVKLKKADEIVEKIAEKTETISKELKEFETMSDGFSDLSEKIQNCEELSSLCNTLVKIGNWAGFTGTALSIIQMTGIIGSDMWPDSDEVINMKLDYVIDIIKGMYTDLEYIETRLDEIETVITEKLNQQVTLNLQFIRNGLSADIQNIAAASTDELKKTYALNFLNDADANILNYLDASAVDYSSYVEYMAGTANDASYIPLHFQITTPYSTTYYKSTVYYTEEPYDFLAHLTTPVFYKTNRIECIMADFTMINPTTLLPFTYEGMEYIKKIILTRFNFNSFVYSDEVTLNSGNSANAKSYLCTSGSYLSKLRNQVNAAYAAIQQDLSKTKNNINGPSTTVHTVQENLSATIDQNYNNCSVDVSENGFKYYSLSLKNYGNWGEKDRWDYKPCFSTKPSYKRILLINETANTVVYLVHKTEYPYSPDLTCDSNKPIEFTKPVTDVTFLEDANATIDTYYKARTNKLLEFAASLAALEVQLALYLDDEDYAVYAQ